MAGKEKTIESIFEELEEKVNKLESRDITLEEAFKTYTEGMKLLKSCNDKLEKVEKKVMLMNEEGNLSEF
ncbi:MAG: exodeoxyribonuclease VII small subunit [Lachnospiraceae bacterium]|nr:exodeoxyribonuclease VII small subunit [Lachnospiraceae bacterium]